MCQTNSGPFSGVIFDSHPTASLKGAKIAPVSEEIIEVPQHGKRLPPKRLLPGIPRFKEVPPPLAQNKHAECD